MASDLTNGAAPNADIEMKEETLDTSTADLPQDPTDPTDPNPPPQPPSSTTTAPPPTEPLSTLLPAPPTTTTTATPTAAPSSTAAAAPPTRPTSIPPPRTTHLPEKPIAHGGPTRQFLNAHLTPHLLEGMKSVAAYEPEKPLLWLSEFLRERSREVEG